MPSLCIGTICQNFISTLTLLAKNDNLINIDMCYSSLVPVFVLTEVTPVTIHKGFSKDLYPGDARIVANELQKC